MNETLTVLLDALPFVIEGAAVTVTAVLGAMFLGLFIGVPLAVGQVYGGRAVRFICDTYVWFFRGVPILVRHDEDGDRATAALFALDSPAQVREFTDWLARRLTDDRGN